MPSFRSLLVIPAIAVAIGARAGAAQAVYRRANVDSAGQLHLVTSTGREIVPPRDSDQVAFAHAEISRDRRSVGWLALYPNCCTSYPIPLELVVLSGGTRRTFKGEGLPIWQWSFADDGRRVVFRQAPVHGDGTSHFEMRDVRSGRLVGRFDADSSGLRRAPAWIRALKEPR